MVNKRVRRVLALTTGALPVMALAVGTAAAHTPGADHQHRHSRGPQVVVSGLNNPRQLSLVGDDEQLLIAEAGKGGTTQITTPEGPSFVGTSGSISSVWWPGYAHDQTPHRIVTGLMSGASADGSFAVGSDGVSARRPNARIYIQETFNPPDALPSPLATTQNGKLLRAHAYGQPKIVADIAQYEADNDPDGMGVDSDPYAVLALHHGELVADAAANDILWVDRSGNISVVHTFANLTTGDCATMSDPPGFPGCNFVPTSLATDEDGHIYVGGLGSEEPGVGEVVELGRNGHRVLNVWTGFTSVSGIAVGEDGTLYVSQLEAPEANPPAAMVTGVLTRISCSGERTDMDVPFPAGLAVDDDNNVYVAAWSVAPDTGLAGPGTSGQVWRVHFDHH